MSLKAALACSLLLVACSGPDTGSVQRTTPPEASFSAVSEMLGRRCGSLDCHGQVGRNLRLYNRYGLRLDATDVSNGVETTDREHADNYRALIGLEPETLAGVVAGDAPDTWTPWRKAFGLEEHEGGEALEPTGPGQACLRSWLAGSVDAASCQGATEPPRP